MLRAKKATPAKKTILPGHAASGVPIVLRRAPFAAGPGADGQRMDRRRIDLGDPHRAGRFPPVGADPSPAMRASRVPVGVLRWTDRWDPVTPTRSL